MQIELLIPILVGINEAVKRAIKLDDRYVPLLSLILGALLFPVFNGFTLENVLTGAIAGLASCGLYDATKKSLLGK